jgi:hypothetical protein
MPHHLDLADVGQPADVVADLLGDVAQGGVNRPNLRD